MGMCFYLVPTYLLECQPAMHLIIIVYTTFILFNKGSSYSQEPEVLQQEINESLTAVDAMQMYVNGENIDVLVPEIKIHEKKSKFKKIDLQQGSMRRAELAAAAAVDYSEEDDSLELMDLGEGKKKKQESSEWEPPQPQDYQTCGFTPFRRSKFPGSHFRVVGGQNAKEGSWPWMAGIGSKEENSTQIVFNCGGSLVSASHVITAAHCLVHHPAYLLIVRLSVTKLTDKASALDVRVKKAVSHPGFDWTAAQDDIAVLFLAETIEFTQTVHPICLPQGSIELSDFQDTFPFIIGWGVTEDGEQSRWLKEVRLPVVSNDVCREAYANLPPGKRTPIKDGHICCGFLEGGRDACQGDSGGPLMLPTETHPRGEIYVLIGIVSLGVGCAQPGIPGVYTRITKYLDWLDKTMENENGLI